jgi:hypothetical protein
MYVVVIIFKRLPLDVNSLNSLSNILIPDHLINETKKQISLEEEISFLNSPSNEISE